MTEMITTTADQVKQELSAKRKTVVADQSVCCQRTLHEWSAPSDENAVWLTYAASYFMNTHGLKWAVDPMRLQSRLPEASAITLGQEMQGLSFVLLTHNHADHLDTGFWSLLADFDCHWIVPDHMLDLFLAVPKMSGCRYTVAVAEKEIVVPDARILPFASWHSSHVPGSGFLTIPETGYRVQTDNGDFLFPGDIRIYDSSFLARFKGVSTVFAHVFLGRTAALMSTPPLLNDFVAFYRACQPQKILLTHLYELARDPSDCWRFEHAEVIKAIFASVAPEIEVVSPSWYERILV